MSDNVDHVDHVLVTGAADGIGHAAAARYARAGHRVTLIDIAADRLSARVDALTAEGCTVRGEVADLADPIAVQAAVERAIAAFGAPVIGVSNAGVAPYVELIGCDVAEWQRVIDINMTGSFVFMQAVIRAMIDAGVRGALCVTSSGAAFQGRVGGGPYSASKAGALMMANVLAVEAGPHGIRVNSVAPGFIDHGYREGLGDFAPADYVDRAARLTPLDHRGSADDIVDAIEFLCSERAAHITGASLRIDGAASVGQYGSAWNKEGA
ncbi:SDR family NAD(P)-dependent oxidoreductase [Leucobacter sp. USHLN153]|uniref:SDR family NAD(P)-dependent oxidoreductase n=1 Tax=Leucobacter sp. USHLN153 TaxID=3081268 RepID=UPI0030182EA2